MARWRKQRLPLMIGFVVTCVGILLTAQQRPYRVTTLETEQLLQRVETSAQRFQRGLDLSGQPVWDRGTADMGGRTGIAATVSDFVRASHDLRDRFGQGQTVKREIEALLHRGATIDSFMQSHLLALRTEQDWLTLRDDLDRLAQMYDIPWQWSRARDARRHADLPGRASS